MAKRKPLEPYRGELSPQEVAAGMNAAHRNAQRLLDDARLLAANGRYPTACSLAVLSIEEAAKGTFLRLIATAKSKKTLKDAWRRYRDHQSKNAQWIVLQLVANGARTLWDLSKVFDSSSDHPAVIDAIKQLGFYTDCFKRGRWSEPPNVIDEGLTKSIIKTAEILCIKDAATTRSVELWIQHVGKSFSTDELIAYFAAMEAAGLTSVSLEEFKKFVENP